MTQPPITPKPIAIPLTRCHELVGISRTQFAYMYVETGLIHPVDLGGRGRSVILSELEEAIQKRAEGIRSGAIIPPVRCSKLKRAADLAA